MFYPFCKTTCPSKRDQPFGLQLLNQIHHVVLAINVFPGTGKVSSLCSWLNLVPFRVRDGTNVEGFRNAVTVESLSGGNFSSKRSASCRTSSDMIVRCISLGISGAVTITQYSAWPCFRLFPNATYIAASTRVVLPRKLAFLRGGCLQYQLVWIDSPGWWER